MTKQDYELIATAIHIAVDENKRDPLGGPSCPSERILAISEVARRIASACALQNPLFKHDVFLKACGL